MQKSKSNFETWLETVKAAGKQVELVEPFVPSVYDAWIHMYITWTGDRFTWEDTMYHVWYNDNWKSFRRVADAEAYVEYAKGVLKDAGYQ